MIYVTNKDRYEARTLWEKMRWQENPDRQTVIMLEEVMGSEEVSNNYHSLLLKLRGTPL